MADKREFSLNLSGGGSSVPMADGEELSLQPCTAKSMGFSLQPCTQEKSMGFSLEPCTQAVEEAFAGDQSAPKRKAPKKRKGEEVSEEEEEPWRAVQLTLLEGEDVHDLDFEEHQVGVRARFAADMQKLFANSLAAPWASARGPDDEKEELTGAVDDVLAPAVSG